MWVGHTLLVTPEETNDDGAAVEEEKRGVVGALINLFPTESETPEVGEGEERGEGNLPSE